MQSGSSGKRRLYPLGHAGDYQNRPKHFHRPMTLIKLLLYKYSVLCILPDVLHTAMQSGFAIKAFHFGRCRKSHI